MYATSEGNDANDGLSWGSAKLTIMAAYDALPALGGTIFIGPNVSATSTLGQGIWLMGSSDPNYASPPAGWRHWKAVSFIGVGTNSFSQQGIKPQTLINCGSSATPTEPCIWLSSSTSIPIDFENLVLLFPMIDVIIGEDSTGAQTANSGVYSANFVNMDTLDCNSCSSAAGPGWLIGGGDSNYIHLVDVQAQGNENAATGSDKQSAILIKPTSGTNSCIGFYGSNIQVAGGPIKYYDGECGGALVVDHVSGEAIPANEGPVWAPTIGVGQIILSNVTNSDPGGSPSYDVRIDGNVGDEESVQLTGFFPDGVLGSSTSGRIIQPTITAVPIADPLTLGINGFSQQGRTYSFLGNTQRAFAPTAVRWTNLAPSGSGSWSVSNFSGSNTLTTGITAPDGTAGAAQATSTSGTIEQLIFYDQNVSIAVGDYFFGGFWERAPNGGAWQDYSNNNVNIFDSGDTVSCNRLLPPIITGTTEWYWVWEFCQVTAAATSPAEVKFTGFFNSTQSLQVYAPLLIHVPTGTIPNDEAFETFYNLVSYDSSCSIGSVCGLRGQGGTQGGTTTMSTGTKTITFSEPYTNKPVCVASDETSIAAVQVTPSITTIILTTSGSSDVVDWVCKGNPN